MDEYLSKPLKQNHLIQTILKCATLGGQLLEKGRESRTSPNDETPGLTFNQPPPKAIRPVNRLRPQLEARASATGPNHGSLESPAMVKGDQDDPLTRVS